MTSLPRETRTQTGDGQSSLTPGTGRLSLLPKGATLGRYVVLEHLGAGGMGVVYAAYDFALDRKVCLKLVRGDTQKRPERAHRLLLEAQAMARLSHPNVTGVHDVGTYEDQVFIAVEFVGGGTLRQWLDKGPHPVDRVLEVFLQAGAGLKAAHHAGLAHRDFKPDNVLIGGDERVRVTDFGLALPATQTELDELQAQTSGTTQRGSGTPLYMSPEQHRGQVAGTKSDQYSFALALWEALEGAHPFAGLSSQQLTARVLSGQLPPLRRTSRKLVDVLRRALSLEPTDRFPSMDALLTALQKASHPAPWPQLVATASFLIFLVAAAPKLAPEAYSEVRRSLGLPPAVTTLRTEVAGDHQAATVRVIGSGSRTASPARRTDVVLAMNAGPSRPGGSRAAGPQDEAARAAAARKGQATLARANEVQTGRSGSSRGLAVEGPEAPSSRVLDLGYIGEKEADQLHQLITQLGFPEDPDDAAAPGEGESESGISSWFRSRRVDPPTATAGPGGLEDDPTITDPERLALDLRLEQMGVVVPSGPRLTPREIAMHAAASLDQRLQSQISLLAPPREIASTQFSLARVLWDADLDKPRAVSLAVEARIALTPTATAPSDELYDEVDEWITSKPGFGR